MAQETQLSIRSVKEWIPLVIMVVTVVGFFYTLKVRLDYIEGNHLTHIEKDVAKIDARSEATARDVAEIKGDIKAIAEALRIKDGE